MGYEFRYKVWDKIAVLKETSHIWYPARVAEILKKNNIVKIQDVRENGDCSVYIEWYGDFYVYADEIMWVADGIALFI